MTNLSKELPSLMYTFEAPRPQKLSLPSPMILYIREHWMSNVYEKLIRSCKYFFSSEALIVSNDFVHDNRSEFHEDEDYQQINFERNELILSKSSKLASDSKTKLWFSGEVTLHCFERPEAVSLLTKYIKKCDIIKLRLSWQILSENEFLFLTGNLKDLSLFKCDIRRNDKSLSLGDILALVPEIVVVEYVAIDEQPMVDLRTSSTRTLPSLPYLRHFQFSKALIHIRFKDFFKFIKAHQKCHFIACFMDSDFHEDLHGKFMTALKKSFPKAKTGYILFDLDARWTLQNNTLKVHLWFLT